MNDFCTTDTDRALLDALREVNAAQQAIIIELAVRLDRAEKRVAELEAMFGQGKGGKK